MRKEKQTNCNKLGIINHGGLGGHVGGESGQWEIRER